MSEANTWGISGPTFLWLYAAAFLLSAFGVWLRRKSLLNAQDGALPSGAPDPYELALLNGGPQLAITIAAAKLHRLGALVTSPSGKKKVMAATRPAAGTEGDGELEHEVFEAVERAPGITSRALGKQIEDSAPIRRITAELTGAGLLLDDATRHKVNGVWLGFLPVIGLGVLRLIAGIQNDRPVAFLAIALAVIVFVTLKVALMRTRATARGQELLDAERDGRKTLGHKPEPAEIPMAVALFGVGALWAADPGLASTLSIPRENAVSSWAGGSGYGGGCGSGGGGGGGCGGGGGGCGGGGCGG